MTVRRLLDEADSRELSEWLVFLEERARREEDARESSKFEQTILNG